MSDLPINAVLPELKAALNARHECVLEAPPGAGKTTGVPLALLDAPWLGTQKILMLEPRRIAARAAAARMADVLGEPLGARVGYRVRLESKVSASTRIEVVTEGILTRMLQDDPALEGVGIVIFDEFHERSLDADLGLALALQAREVYGDLRAGPLKLLVMSATLDGQQVAKLLNDAPRIRSAGKSFPVDIRYGAPWLREQDVVARTQATIEQALADHAGSLLVFLPGTGEIKKLAGNLAERLNPNTLLAPLYGDLSLSEQRQAIEPAPAGKRKVVLATNIAETSLTIEGISVVVDAGLCREPRFDPNTGMTRLHTQRISRASSDQRAGRAGRLGPGCCYRLWSESQQQALAAHSGAEIEQADLAPLALQLLQWGVGSPSELRWLTSPPAGAWAAALELLAQLGGAEKHQQQWRLTAHGQLMAALPMHPRLAHMMARANNYRLLPLAAKMAAVLSERDPLGRAQSADIQLRLNLCERPGRLANLAQQFLQTVKAKLPQVQPTATIPEADAPGFLLAQAFPDRLAQSRSANGLHYRLANGRAGQLFESDRLRQSPWLAVAAIGGAANRQQDTIFMAASLNPALFDGPLAHCVKSDITMGWDDSRERFVGERNARIGALILKTQILAVPQGQEKIDALLALVRNRGLGLLDWTAPAKQLRARVKLVAGTEPGWPDMSDAGLGETLEHWLAPYLADVKNLSDFKKLDLQSMLQSLLDWPQQQALNRLAPTHIDVPSGQSIALDYTAEPPVLAVKLQAMFGCTETPRILNGQMPVTVHLLSPAGRALQVTQDLGAFWAGAYVEVKKEMKGRYPKHPWPDDPLQAVATHKTKRHLN
ncbi:ATP-dependent helicase HrpB [Simiduia sp. 21SJ11W-1]|uniref:ATP-dependent helicase HrpB n=1 Tax=Simiduia sp. 21SJ11W-1 TaxID=2909669 RepID=UPI0020A05FE2|nr:ATP-dependent helicase HrpB [Simiduia sp. 21SJ11W-1]UTA46960.1 ATP-dependent helicase HrpB [Simiduia sp. 21SJ11W-1]